ncbi:hypothetical protein [Solirubrum puertoriconensis]|uniref:Uncharacterized protein n=1 Tax=Solirubrum puertoriconensis TaxID=1751427 RepID=A0A9X0HK38_SOLP1|nr:hypothetical protein [Solirubrum puertoriconensis]KUG07409.1 hypothetical protein ASU33_13735 [Solirubrum puertoriconensis]
MKSLLTHPYWFFIIGVILFVLAWQINLGLNIPAEGIDRLYAFAPLATWLVMKTRTMFKDE